jgi:hypothetical protein
MGTFALAAAAMAAVAVGLIVAIAIPGILWPYAAAAAGA